MDSPIPPLKPPRPFFIGGSPRHHRSTASDASDGDARQPPSFAFPFQAYPGNPDPIPHHRRHNSFEDSLVGNPHAFTLDDTTFPRSGSLSDFQRPHAPFMSGASTPTSTSSIYRSSAAANLIPHSQSQTFRAPFLSPASRPSSSAWSPPPPSNSLDPNPSSTARPLSSLSKTNLRPSTLLIRNVTSAPNLRETPNTTKDASLNEKETPNEKVRPVKIQNHFPPPPRSRLAWWLTALCILAGAAAAALLCWTGIQSVKSHMLNENSLCLVMDENWESGQLDDSKWARDVELGGFGNGEFEMTTASDTNVYIKNGQLYILPTLTSDQDSSINQDGAVYTLDGCTGTVPAPVTTNTTSTSGGNSTQATNSTTNGTGNGYTNGQSNTTNGTGNGYTNANNGGNGAGRRAVLQIRQNTANNTNSTSGSSTNNTNSTSGSSTNDTNPALSGGSNANSDNPCRAVTNYALGTVINPVQSGRINTKGKVGIKYGRVEVVAKLARGDWLWPAIWMLPENNTYGAWPLSGEIDILEARGNDPSYPGQGVNFARSTLNYGLDKGLLPISGGALQGNPLMKLIYGWFGLKRTTFAEGFHTYAMEWDEHFVRFYVDSRVKSSLVVDIGKRKGAKKSQGSVNGNGGQAGTGGFWDMGKFPATAQNASNGEVVVLQNPWVQGTVAAPFDQKFYLVINMAVGGTSGWFPDELGNKPWFDGSATAMRDFAKAQDQWYPTWPQDEDDRAFRVSSVKMWSKDCQ